LKSPTMICRRNAMICRWFQKAEACIIIIY
jgi:hypothetical protein